MKNDVGGGEVKDEGVGGGGWEAGGGDGGMGVRGWWVCVWVCVGVCGCM